VIRDGWEKTATSHVLGASMARTACLSAAVQAVVATQRPAHVCVRLGAMEKRVTGSVQKEHGVLAALTPVTAVTPKVVSLPQENAYVNQDGLDHTAKSNVRRVDMVWSACHAVSVRTEQHVARLMVAATVLQVGQDKFATDRVRLACTELTASFAVSVATVPSVILSMETASVPQDGKESNATKNVRPIGTVLAVNAPVCARTAPCVIMSLVPVYVRLAFVAFTVRNHAPRDSGGWTAKTHVIVLTKMGLECGVILSTENVHVSRAGWDLDVPSHVQRGCGGQNACRCVLARMEVAVTQ